MGLDFSRAALIQAVLTRIGYCRRYEDVARDTNRGHTVRAVCESFQGAKDSGFKVLA